MSELLRPEQFHSPRPQVPLVEPGAWGVFGQSIAGCQVFPRYLQWTPSTQSCLILRAAGAGWGKSDALDATSYDVRAPANGLVLPGNTVLDQLRRH